METVETDLKIPDADRIYNYWDYMHEEPPESFDPNDPSFVNAEYIMNMFNKLVDGKYKTRSFKLYNSYTDLVEEEGIIGQTAYVQEEGYENSFFVNDGTTWIQFSADKKPTIDYFENNTGTQLDTETELGSVVMVFKNGVLLEPTADYSIVGSTITFLTALEATDKVSVINGDISANNMARYQLKPNVITNGSNTGLVIQANKIYKFTNVITTLTLTSAETSDNESRIYFTTGSSINFTDNTNLKWLGGTTPTLVANTIYRITICNGLAEIDNFGTTS